MSNWDFPIQAKRKVKYKCTGCEDEDCQDCCVHPEWEDGKCVVCDFFDEEMLEYSDG